MTMHDDVKVGDAVVLKHNDGPLGMIRGYAAQDMKGAAGGSAIFRVDLVYGAVPGITALTLNVNNWDVWRQDDPDLAVVVLNHFLPVEGR